MYTEDPEAPTLNRFTPATHSTGFKATDRAKTKGIHSNTGSSRYLIQFGFDRGIAHVNQSVSVTMGLPPVCVCTYLQKFIFLNGVVLVEVHFCDEFP